MSTGTERRALPADALDLARMARNQRAHEAEWLARPLGRLGRRLAPEVDRYVEFFAIARGNGDAHA